MRGVKPLPPELETTTVTHVTPAGDTYAQSQVPTVIWNKMQADARKLGITIDELIRLMIENPNSR